MEATRRLSPDLVELASAFLSGAKTPVQPKGAATVVLLREPSGHARDAEGDGPPNPEGPEVYLLRRHRGMAFAAGMYAFPGGTVDDRDSDHAVAWAGPSPQAWAERLACAEGEARALVCAAVRETFEEAGVLLAGPTPDSLVEDTTGDDWEQDRAALVDRRLGFADFLERRGLVLRTDLLGAWAHWITPEFEPRRYDTRFFVAAMPQGQRTRDVSGEADEVVWMRPADAVAGVDAGELAMMVPTYVTVKEITAHATVDEVIAAAPSRTMTTVVPGVELIDGEGFLTVPDGVVP